MPRRQRRYWLFKSEPDCYSLDDFKADGTAPWDGIRNYQARNHIRDDMGPGDGVLFYHSSVSPPGVVGLAEIVSEPYPDATAFDPNHEGYDPKSSENNPRWLVVDVAYRETFPTMLTKQMLAETPGLTEMVLHKNSRLSVQPLTKAEFDRICKLARKPG